MRNLFAWVMIVLGLMLAVGGAGMIVVGLISTDAKGVAAAGGAWTFLGLILTFVGFRLRVVPSGKV
jgi:hypothetical protein